MLCLEIATADFITHKFYTKYDNTNTIQSSSLPLHIKDNFSEWPLPFIFLPRLCSRLLRYSLRRLSISLLSGISLELPVMFNSQQYKLFLACNQIWSCIHTFRYLYIRNSTPLLDTIFCLICLGCYNKTTYTVWFTTVGIYFIQLQRPGRTR